MVYRNKKTQGLYETVGTVPNRTNAQDGQLMIKYRSLTDGQEHVREINEFYEKFEPFGKPNIGDTFYLVMGSMPVGLFATKEEAQKYIESHNSLTYKIQEMKLGEF